MTTNALYQIEPNLAFIYAEKLLTFVKGWQKKDISLEYHELDDTSRLPGIVPVEKLLEHFSAKW